MHLPLKRVTLHIFKSVRHLPPVPLSPPPRLKHERFYDGFMVRLYIDGREDDVVMQGDGQLPVQFRLHDARLFVLDDLVGIYGKRFGVKDVWVGGDGGTRLMLAAEVKGHAFQGGLAIHCEKGGGRVFREKLTAPHKTNLSKTTVQI